jgi:hypothetical protein
MRADCRGLARGWPRRGGAALGDRLLGIKILTGSQFDDTFVSDRRGRVLFFDGRDNLQGGGGRMAAALLDGGEENPIRCRKLPGRGDSVEADPGLASAG